MRIIYGSPFFLYSFLKRIIQSWTHRSSANVGQVPFADHTSPVPIGSQQRSKVTTAAILPINYGLVLQFDIFDDGVRDGLTDVNLPTVGGTTRVPPR